MFEDCGWEYIRDFWGHSYFRKPTEENEDESIFCDDESRLDMMKRMMIGREPFLLIFILTLISHLHTILFQEILLNNLSSGWIWYLQLLWLP